MFGWLKKKDGVYYQPKERSIYRYWDGKKYVDEDPMILSRKVAEIGPELKIDIDVSNSASKDSTKAGLLALAKAQKIFSVKPFSEGGLLEDEVWELFNHFLIWRGGVKKNLKKSQTSLEATPASLESSSVASRPTMNGSACGSIVSELSTEPVEPLPTELPSDSASPIQV